MWGCAVQVIDSWARHALSAPAACWQHAVRPLSSIPRLAGHILSKGAKWLLDGLQSVRDPAGLSSVKPGIEIDEAVMPGMCRYQWNQLWNQLWSQLCFCCSCMTNTELQCGQNRGQHTVCSGTACISWQALQNQRCRANWQSLCVHHMT